MISSASLSLNPFSTSVRFNFLVTGVAWAKVTGSDSVLVNETVQAGYRSLLLPFQAATFPSRRFRLFRQAQALVSGAFR